MSIKSSFYQLICILLSVILSIPQQSLASDADKYIAETHRIARERAHGAMNEILLNAMYTAMAQEIGADMNQITNMVRHHEGIIQALASKMDGLYQLGLEDANSVTTEILKGLATDYNKMVSNIKTQKIFLEDIQLSASYIRSTTRRTVELFLKELDHACYEGLVFHPFTKVLPATKALMPVFEINFQTTVYGEDNGESIGNNAVTLGGTSEEKALWASLYAANVVLASKVITGSFVLTSQAFSALAFSTQASILATAFAATAVVAVIVLATRLHQARQESERIVREQKEIFNKKATSEHARQYFKEECAHARSGFDSLVAEMDRLEKNDNNLKMKIVQEGKEIESFLAEYIQVLSQYQSKREELGQSLNESSTEDERREVLKKLQSTSEYQNFEDTGKKLTSPKLVGIIKYLFLKHYSEAEELASNVKKSVASAITQIDLKILDQRARQLNDIVAYKGLRDIEIAMNFLWEEQLHEYKDLAELSAELDQLVIERARLTFSLKSHDGGSKSWLDLNQRFLNWGRKLEALKLKYPGFTFIEHLSAAFKALQFNNGI